MHNLSNYDANFIVTDLGNNSKSISVIPNCEEKFISFSKYVSNTFTVRFIDTFRFMASSLSNLAANIVTPNLTKFRETAKVFAPADMPLVTRKTLTSILTIGKSLMRQVYRQRIIFIARSWNLISIIPSINMLWRFGNI